MSLLRCGKKTLMFLLCCGNLTQCLFNRLTITTNSFITHSQGLCCRVAIRTNVYVTDQQSEQKYWLHSINQVFLRVAIRAKVFATEWQSGPRYLFQSGNQKQHLLKCGNQNKGICHSGNKLLQMMS